MIVVTWRGFYFVAFRGGLHRAITPGVWTTDINNATAYRRDRMLEARWAAARTLGVAYYDVGWETVTI